MGGKQDTHRGRGGCREGAVGDARGLRRGVSGGARDREGVSFRAAILAQAAAARRGGVRPTRLAVGTNARRGGGGAFYGTGSSDWPEIGAASMAWTPAWRGRWARLASELPPGSQASCHTSLGPQSALSHSTTEGAMASGAPIAVFTCESQVDLLSSTSAPSLRCCRGAPTTRSHPPTAWLVRSHATRRHSAVTSRARRAAASRAGSANAGWLRRRRCREFLGDCRAQQPRALAA